MISATAAAVLGLAASAIGTGASVYGQSRAASASRRQEAIRQRQMELQAQQEQRKAIRSAMQARAAANTALTAQGGGTGSASAGLGQQVQAGGQAVGDTLMNLGLGREMFAANAAFSEARTISSIGTGISNFGSALFGSADAIGRLGKQWAGNGAPMDGWGARVYEDQTQQFS